MEIFKGRQVFILFFIFFIFSFSRDIANQGFAIFPMKVRKYIIKVLRKNLASVLILYILYVTYTF